MPHCGKAMYNNLLWANWSAERLPRVAIIGNSFTSYSERWSHTNTDDAITPYTSSVKPLPLQATSNTARTRGIIHLPCIAYTITLHRLPFHGATVVPLTASYRYPATAWSSLSHATTRSPMPSATHHYTCSLPKLSAPYQPQYGATAVNLP